ncbi:MAG: non-canonical purine NTP diphosphatase [Bacteroidaceae bacterium]|nr:non-canonical purine NTP diphosphatase [Bacteroidaceae bacterium]
MKTIVFASNNAHKLEEIRAILGNKFEIKSLKDIGCDADIPETGVTFRENALQKAQYVKEHYNLDCFADDSGLQVEALNGEPGVYSARYATINGCEVTKENKDDVNMNVLLEKLSNNTERKACFRTSIALVLGEEIHYFDGVVEGTITTDKRGEGGFGYDPIFMPDGYDKTFAELGNDIKNHISHRARAVAKLAEFLSNI